MATFITVQAFSSPLPPGLRHKSPKWRMTVNRSDFDICVWSLATLRVSCGIQRTLLIHLALSEWVQTYFSIIYRNTLSPWSSSLPKDLMVHNDSQDGNISLLTEVWPWSMSRELSVRPYFGTYLQTSTQSLFWFVYFFPFGKSSEKILRFSRMFEPNFSCCSFSCLYVPLHIM